MRHAVVIGSGMGGLTAARLLQREGYQVTVLEQHSRPGGFLHRFFREGLPYDTGFHYLGGVGPGDAMGQALRHLGVFDALDFVPLDPDGFDRLWFPDLEFRVPVGFERYRHRLIETFPHEAPGIHAVLDVFRDAVDAYGLYRLRETPDLGHLLRVEGRPLAHLLDAHLTDPRCKAVLAAQGLLYGVASHEAPVGLHALVLHHFLSGAHSIDGGGDRLAMSLVRRLRHDGATLRLKTTATRIEVDGRRATAVHTGHGERLPADLVIANVHPRIALELLPPEATRRAYKTRVLDQRLGHGHLGVYVEVEGRVGGFGRSNLYRHRTWGDSYRSARTDDIPLYFASAPSEHPENPREDRGVVLMIAPMAWSQVSPWASSTRGDRPEAYTRHKEQLTRTALDTLFEDFPDLRGRVRRVEASTPLTTTHYTRSPRGAAYGHLHSIDQMGRYRPAQQLRVRNVLLVGQGVFTPGILGVTLSAYHAVGRVVGLPRLIQELREA